MSETHRSEQIDKSIVILGGAKPLARALAVSLMRQPATRVVLMDRPDPTIALLDERTPLLGRGADGHELHSWREQFGTGKVAGASVGHDSMAWTVGSLGLLRPARIVLCVALRSQPSFHVGHWSPIAALSDELAGFLGAVREYTRLVRLGDAPMPTVMVCISGVSGASSVTSVSRLAQALIEEQLGDLGPEVSVVLMPRLLGAGPVADADFQFVLRRLLLGGMLRVDTEQPLPQWIDQNYAAQLVDAVLTADQAGKQRRAMSAVSENPSGALMLPGYAGSLGYLARIAADEVDRLLSDPVLRRCELVDQWLPREATASVSSALADAIRLAVRWNVANV
ncbi:hypothetical protein [Gemmatimonas sp.]|uniref:hypothetical protein n=1 Tax=Gemmatimonas sp. TaxID=1962908 RepID=UPI00356911DB